MSGLAERLAREARDTIIRRMVADGASLGPEESCAIIAAAIRAALDEAAGVASEFANSPDDREAGTAESIAAAIEALK